jgi:hypothetical protein
VLNPIQLVVIALGGWMNQRQPNVIDYLREGNQVLREQRAERRLRFTDEKRRRVAVRAQALQRKLLVLVATLVCPILYWPGTESSLHKNRCGVSTVKITLRWRVI